MQTVIKLVHNGAVLAGSSLIAHAFFVWLFSVITMYVAIRREGDPTIENLDNTHLTGRV